MYKAGDIDALTKALKGLLSSDTLRIKMGDNSRKLAESKFDDALYFDTDVVRILGLGAWATHCHNHILQIMFEGGILSLVMFVGLLYVNIKSCAKAWRNSNFNASRICMYSIFVYLIIGITEHYEYAPMYLILILPFYFCNKNLDELKINGLIKC